MGMTEAALPGGAEDEATSRVLQATRELVEGVMVVEHRLAAVAALADRFGTQYLTRATTELQDATDHLAQIEEQRRSAVNAASALLGHPSVETLDELVAIADEPLRSFLLGTRAELSQTQRRIGLIRGRADDVLGRRITLIVEALATPGDITKSIYGRSVRPRPRRVSAHL
jgi:hypothetical protein